MFYNHLLPGNRDFIFGRYSSFLSCRGPTLEHQVKFHIRTTVLQDFKHIPLKKKKKLKMSAVLWPGLIINGVHAFKILC